MESIELAFMQVCDLFIIYLHHHYSVEIVKLLIWRQAQNFFWIMGQISSRMRVLSRKEGFPRKQFRTLEI